MLPADVKGKRVLSDDIDLDGDQDLLLGGDRSICVTLLGNGDGTFAAPMNYRGGANAGTADFNGDAFPDLFTYRAAAMNAFGSGQNSFEIEVDTERMVPLHIWDDEGARWVIGPEFLEVDGGLAPRVVLYQEEYYEPSFESRFEFQVVDGVWILKEGEAGRPDDPSSIERFSLTDFRLIRRLE